MLFHSQEETCSYLPTTHLGHGMGDVKLSLTQLQFGVYGKVHGAFPSSGTAEKY